MKQFLLITDLDNTLIGDYDSLAHFNKILSRNRYLIKIVYATGRSLFLYQELLKETKLLKPDALIASVGAEIYLDSDDPTQYADWENELSENWNRDLVLDIAAQFSGLKIQAQSEQRPFKISYHLPVQDAPKVISRLEQLLKEQKIEAKLIYSGGKDLDILPAKSGKGLAACFLQKRHFSDTVKTIVCGDSGNDITLFEIPQVLGILVGNAQPELRDWHQQRQSPNFYLSTANYAAGILEGLENFGVLAA